MAGDEPLRGFGERIIKRARLPISVILALPLVVVGIDYFFFLLEKGRTFDSSVKELKDAIALFAGFALLPPIILAFCRELQVHELLDKLLGVRKKVEQDTISTLQKLATDSGYEKPDQISAAPEKAREWFYSYVNSQTVLRAYAFEIWEAYYVGLYISLATAVTAAILLLLALFLQDKIAWSFFVLCVVLFLFEWAVRHWSTIPKILKLPSQQIGEIKPSSEVLNEAKRRFG